MTLRETEVVTGAGPDAYAAPPFLPPSKEGEKETSLVPPAPAAPPATITPEQAAVVGQAVAGYTMVGLNALLKKHPERAAELHEFLLAQGVPNGINGAAPRAHAFFAGAAARNALKYNIVLPYVDEAITVVGIGAATYGLFGGKPKNENKPDDKSKKPAAPARESSPASQTGEFVTPAARRVPDEVDPFEEQ